MFESQKHSLLYIILVVGCEQCYLRALDASVNSIFVLTLYICTNVSSGCHVNRFNELMDINILKSFETTAPLQASYGPALNACNSLKVGPKTQSILLK